SRIRRNTESDGTSRITRNLGADPRDRDHNTPLTSDAFWLEIVPPTLSDALARGCKPDMTILCTRSKLPILGILCALGLITGSVLLWLAQANGMREARPLTVAITDELSSAPVSGLDIEIFDATGLSVATL